MWPSPLWTRPPLFWPASCQRWNQTEQETSLPHHTITSPDSPTGSNSACCRRHKTNLAVSSGAAAPAINHLTSCDCKPPITEKLWNALECDKTRANQLSVIGWKLYHFPGFCSDRLICLRTPFIDPQLAVRGVDWLPHQRESDETLSQWFSPDGWRQKYTVYLSVLSLWYRCRFHFSGFTWMDERSPAAVASCD